MAQKLPRCPRSFATPGVIGGRIAALETEGRVRPGQPSSHGKTLSVLWLAFATSLNKQAVLTYYLGSVALQVLKDCSFLYCSANFEVQDIQLLFNVLRSCKCHDGSRSRRVGEYNGSRSSRLGEYNETSGRVWDFSETAVKPTRIYKIFNQSRVFGNQC